MNSKDGPKMIMLVMIVIGVVMMVVVVMMVLDFAVMMTMIIVIMMVTSAGTWGPCGATLLYPVQPLQSLTFFSKPKPSH